MDFSTLQDRVKFVLDNNDGGISQAFTDARIKQAINWAYSNEYSTAMLEGQRSWFIATTSVNWIANEVTFSLPSSLRKNSIIRIKDITNSGLGEELTFSETGLHGDVFWYNRNTLQWGTSGPSTNKTLEFTFIPSPVDMINNSDEPDLLPELYHDIIIWGAAVLLLEIADQSAPQSWYKNLEDSRINLHKYLSLGRPQTDTPKIVNTDATNGSTFGLY